MQDTRLLQYREAALAMLQGNFNQTFPIEAPDQVGQLGQALAELSRHLERRCEEVKTLAQVTERINAGLVLDEVMDRVYRSFRTILPYDRMSLALLDPGQQQLTVRWTRTEAREILLGVGYSAALESGSLRAVLDSGQPRILNDLRDYLARHPRSESTRLIVDEGMQSSLTCPLVTRGRAVGLLFFTSINPATYRQVHQDIFLQLAGQVALIVEKSRLYQELRDLQEAKDRFLSLAGQELRLPLVAAMDTLDGVLAGGLGDLNPGQHEALRSVAANQQSVLDHLQRLLGISALASGALELQLRWTDLHLLLENLRQAHTPAAEAKGLQIKVAHADQVPQVRLDPDRIREVLCTLLTNAIRLSSAGSTLILSSRLAGTCVEIRLTEEGPCLPEDRQSEAFTLQEAAPSGDRNQASGLGQAIALRIVEAHGGSLRAESHEGVGTTFVLSLPGA